MSRLEARLSDWTGFESALIFPSTLHALTDVLWTVARPGDVVWLDRWIYSLGRQCSAAATGRGALLFELPHNDISDLSKTVERSPNTAQIYLCDGLYAHDGSQAPLARVLPLVEQGAGWVIVDDAHGLGTVGVEPSAATPHGRGGGGVVRHQGIESASVVYVSSLAKNLGVSMAMVAGSRAFIDVLRKAAGHLEHSSPPSAWSLCMAEILEDAQRRFGEQQRSLVLRHVTRLRDGLLETGLVPLHQTLFPIQTLAFRTARTALNAARLLLSRGIWVAFDRAPDDFREGAVLRIVLTARHDDACIDGLLAAVAELAKEPKIRGELYTHAM